MGKGARLIAAIVFGLLAYAFSCWIPYAVVLPLEYNWLAMLLALATGAMAGRFIFVRMSDEREGGVLRDALRDALVFGCVGFAAGFFGPMLLGGGNQGPLLGVFITGPLGFVTGLIRGLLRGRGVPSGGV